MIWKIFGLVLSTLTDDGKYSLVNTDYLTQPIEMQLSKKLFFETFSAILDILKKDNSHSL